MQECALGSSLNSTSRSEETGHFLDLSQPATCSGNLVAWHFCYYANTVMPNEVLGITFRVWRPQNGNRYVHSINNAVCMLSKLLVVPILLHTYLSPQSMTMAFIGADYHIIMCTIPIPKSSKCVVASVESFAQSHNKS